MRRTERTANEIRFEQSLKTARSKLHKQYNAGRITRAELEYELENIAYKLDEIRYERRNYNDYDDYYEDYAM